MNDIIDEQLDNDAPINLTNVKLVKPTQPKKPKRDFPQYSIEESRKIIDVIKEFNAGNPWSPTEVAGALGMGKGSKFFYLTASSRDYGLTVGTRESAKIEIGDIGRKFAYPKNQEEEYQAILDAFLNIEIFRKVFEYYQGENLPEIQYLKNTLKTEFGVSEPLQDDFYELYQKNLSFLKSAKLKTKSDEHKTKEKTTSSSEHTIVLGESTNSGTLVAFVAMPFSEKTSQYPKGYFDEVLKHLITPAAVKANFNARTAKKSGSEVIQSTIVNDLDSADLVIVDLSEHNPNVLFELGMRIAFDKPVCLIRAKGTAAIFDIDHMLRVYDYNPCLWPSTLEQDIPGLSEHIAETWASKDKERSYLSILRENK
ncbi:hypothetical protein [Pseudomonas frederiksbergensis]|nr:hypothetical protein [Pseudomonas frederiksbergensis]